ncbi:MAG: hypothetical protein ACP5RS_07330 [Thermoplasmata archaeon]
MLDISRSTLPVFKLRQQLHQEGEAYIMIWQQYVRKGKVEDFKSKIDMQKYAIERCVEGGLRFSVVVMD